MSRLSAEDALNLAEARLEAGDFESARALYGAVLAALPNNERARLGLAHLDAHAPENPNRNISGEEAETLIGLYNQKRFPDVIARGSSLAREYPFSHTLWNILAAAHQALGNLSEAERGFRKAAELNPDSAEAHNNLGVVLQQLGNPIEAISVYLLAIQIKPRYAEAHYNLGNSLKKLGKHKEAISAYRHAAEIRPSYAEAYNNMGASLQEEGKFEEAVRAYRCALEIRPAYPEAHNNIGIALLGQGRREEALEAFERAVKVKPDYAEARNNIGVALQEQARFHEAARAHACAVGFNPFNAGAHYNMGNALKNLGRHVEAISAYQLAIEVKPDYAEAFNNLGVALQQCGEFDKAIDAHRRALEVKPLCAEAHFNLGNALHAQHRLTEAITAHRRAIEIQPNYAEAHNNMGGSLHRQGKLVEALTAYRRACEINRRYAEAFYNLGAVQTELAKLDEAILAFQTALRIRPGYAAAEAQIINLALQMCNWDEYPRMVEASARLGIETESVPSFAFLSLCDEPQQQLARAARWVRERYCNGQSQFPEFSLRRPGRLRIGYFGATFSEHATMYLMSGMLREHDRTRFEIFAYSYGHGQPDAWYQYALSKVDHFFDVRYSSDHEIACLARSHNLDIAIDLMGHTRHTRSQLFSLRPAPIQVNFLGYPGSMGADFIDYIVADSVVIPAAERNSYIENVIYLPHSYLPNDEQRSIESRNLGRADCDLPLDAFVLCCFNDCRKISPREFEIWMRVLMKVDRSVLWLMKSNEWAAHNLMREAAKRGVDPSRIIFAEKLPHTEHLERQRLADLFVDTFSYNAHTTASDSLWAGVPIVTMAGRQFAARVAASLLTALGMLELITQNEEEYEQLITMLASREKLLVKVRDKLKERRMKSSLFNARQYTRSFEGGVQRAYEMYSVGMPTQDIWVTGSEHIDEVGGA